MAIYVTQNLRHTGATPTGAWLAASLAAVALWAYAAWQFAAFISEVQAYREAILYSSDDP